jgi:crotonobetainyl-CoA:carnitine CoA-transferase CaiB-like acyl-CoA transferase
MGIPGPIAERIDRAIRAKPRDHALFGLIVRHLATGLQDASLWQPIDEAGAEFAITQPVFDLAQVSSSPLLAGRAMVRDVEHPAYGRLPLIDTPLAIAGRARSGPYRFQPTLGQDNEEILGDLLGHRAELAELRAAGVIA